jgi:hypothetical protein
VLVELEQLELAQMEMLAFYHLLVRLVVDLVAVMAAEFKQQEIAAVLVVALVVLLVLRLEAEIRLQLLHLKEITAA